MQKMAYHLDKSLAIPLYQQLCQQIKLAIHYKELKLGDRLPAKKKLSRYLQISQNTVEAAYSQLCDEGYIESFPRKGFYVCFHAEHFFPHSLSLSYPKSNFSPHTHVVKQNIVDFNPNYIDTTFFPFKQWKKCGQHLLQLSQCGILNLGESQGEKALRVEICHYLAASRGVNCRPEQIIIASGMENSFQQLILLWEQLYPQDNFYYGMESYGYDKIDNLLKLYQKNVIKLPLNHLYQLDLASLFAHAINVVCVTPSNVYPFGQVISISQRQKLLEWANLAEDRFIIEDDYDSEFRYKGSPIPALKSLDSHNKVIYLGSFSKLLMPSLRVSFMVLPDSLLSAYHQYCAFLNCAVPRLLQQQLADFMGKGEFEKHIHRMRKIYRRKMELLCHLFQHYHNIQYYGEHSGFNLLIEIKSSQYNMAQLIALAQQQQINLHPIYYQDKILFSIGFGHLSEAQIEKSIKQLLCSWAIS